MGCAPVRDQKQVGMQQRTRLIPQAWRVILACAYLLDLGYVRTLFGAENAVSLGTVRHEILHLQPQQLLPYDIMCRMLP